MANQRAQRIIFWEEGHPSFSDIITLQLEQLTVLAEYVDKNGFVLSRDRTITLAQEMNITREKVMDILSFLGNIYGQKKEISLTDDELWQEFMLFAQRNDPNKLVPEMNKKKEYISRLFQDKPHIEIQRKKEDIMHGLIPKAINFRSICEIRPVFDLERTKIIDYLPVVLVNIHVTDNIGEERILLFQMDETMVKEMEDFVGLIKKKLDLMEKAMKNLNQKGGGD